MDALKEKLDRPCPPTQQIVHERLSPVPDTLEMRERVRQMDDFKLETAIQLHEQALRLCRREQKRRRRHWKVAAHRAISNS